LHLAQWTEASSPPPNLLKNPPQPLSLRRIHHLHKSHPSFELQTKRRMPLAILAVHSMPFTVDQNSLQPIEIRAHHIHVLVNHHSRQMLPRRRIARLLTLR
jgi:hypothetical protein